MPYNFVSVQSCDLAKEIQYKDVKQITVGLDTDSFNTPWFAEHERKLWAILQSNEKAIPNEVGSIGYGKELHVSPYFDDVKKIVDIVKERIQKFGYDNCHVINLNAVNEDYRIESSNPVTDKITQIRQQFSSDNTLNADNRLKN